MHKERKTKMKYGLLLILMGSVQALAGGTSGPGNGGVSVVCRNQAKQIVGKPEVLDLFEGREEKYKLKYDYDRNIELEVLFEIAEERMDSNPYFLAHFQSALLEIRERIVFLSRHVGLEPTNDAFPIIRRKNCGFEQLANYADDGKIYVDQEIYDRLDTVNRAAFFVHETVYALARLMVGDTSSVNSRRLTAQLLARNPTPEVIAELIQKVYGNGLSPQPAPAPQPAPKPTPKAFEELLDGIYTTPTHTSVGSCPLRLKRDRLRKRVYLVWDERCGGSYYRLTCGQDSCTTPMPNDFVLNDYFLIMLLDQKNNWRCSNGQYVKPNWKLELKAVPIAPGYFVFQIYGGNPTSPTTGCLIYDAVYSIAVE